MAPQNTTTLFQILPQWIGKTAVVTGASAGIGTQILIDLAKNGINAVGFARRGDRLRQIAQSHANLPGKIHVHEVDVSNSDSIKAGFDWVESQLGGVDILVNNAGTFRESPTFDACDNVEDIQNVIATNFTGLVLCSKWAYVSMAKRNVPGYIININSVAGHYTNIPFTMNIYPATKHAVTASTDLFRRELFGMKNDKVRVAVRSEQVF